MNKLIIKYHKNVPSIPLGTFEQLYLHYATGVNFVTFMQMCDYVGGKYHIDSDYLNALVVDCYESIHPEVM